MGNRQSFADEGTRLRTSQPQVVAKEDESVQDNKDSPETSNPEEADEDGVQGTKPTKATYDAIDVPLSTDPTEDVGKNLLNTAILSKLSGRDVGDDVKDYILTGIAEAGLKAMANVQPAQSRGGEE